MNIHVLMKMNFYFTKPNPHIIPVPQNTTEEEWKNVCHFQKSRQKVQGHTAQEFSHCFSEQVSYRMNIWPGLV